MNILIVGPSWVGDMVMAQSLFRCLRQQHPDCSIDVLAPAWSQDILQRMPEVNRAMDLPLAHGELGLGKRWRLGRELAQQHYDQAIVLPNSFKSALLPRFAGIPLRTGWRGEARGWLLNDCRRLDKQAYPLMVERFAALAYPPGAGLPEPLPRPALQVEESGIPVLMQKLGLQSEREIVVLCPGAEFGPAKKWPEAHYAKVAGILINEGKQIWIMGSAKDSGSAEQILEDLPEDKRSFCINMAGRTAMGEAIDLMSLASLVISNDSGLMHIAAALNRKLIVIYGSTSPQFTPPLADRVDILRLGLSCSPCFKRECPLGHLDCLKKLQPAMVIDTIISH
jgi:heptosyltransferase-2